jgi:hypothetical protein
MVTGGPGVSALGSSPIRQREVLLARVLLLLHARRARPKAWEGRRAVRGQRRRGIQLSFEGLLSRDGRAPSRSSKSFSRRSSGEGRSRERVRARGLPSQDSFFGKKGSSSLLSGSAGSTRLMKHGVQCSRGSRDDRSGRASPSRGSLHWVRRADLSSRQLEENFGGNGRAPSPARASDLVRGKAREASRGPDRIGLRIGCFSVGSILFARRVSARRAAPKGGAIRAERVAALSVPLDVLHAHPQWS